MADVTNQQGQVVVKTTGIGDFSTMTAQDQLRLLRRIESLLADAKLAAGQLPGGRPLIEKINDAQRLSDAWRWDQEGE